MGTLVIPTSGLVYVDTAPIIYSVEENPDYKDLLLPLWEAVAKNQIEVVTSELTLLETLVLPLRNGDEDIADAYEDFLNGTDISLSPISLMVLRDAASIRATHNLKVPDAIHAATALHLSCVQLITNDADLRRVSSLNIIVLKDLLV